MPYRVSVNFGHILSAVISYITVISSLIVNISNGSGGCVVFYPLAIAVNRSSWFQIRAG